MNHIKYWNWALGTNLVIHFFQDSYCAVLEATPMIQQSNIKFIKIQEDYWKSDTGWTCHFCEASFKFEIAFKNHLKNRKECNKDLICLECTKRMKLADLKNHIMIHSPKCSGGSAVLQDHYLKSLTA